MCKQNQNCLFSKKSHNLSFVLSNISETRSWISNLRPDLNSWKNRCPIEQYCIKQNQNCFLKSHPITFYTANYNSTNLIQYKGPGVSHFVAFFITVIRQYNWRIQAMVICYCTLCNVDIVTVMIRPTVV